MNKRIQKHRSDVNINTVSTSPTVQRKHKSFLLPQIKDSNLLSTSKQNLITESQKDLKSKKSKSEANSPQSSDSIPPSSTFDQFSQRAKSISLNISSEKPLNHNTSRYFQSSSENPETNFPIPKEIYKFKVIAAAIEEEPLKYHLKFHKENSNLKIDDPDKKINNLINDGENETLIGQLENNTKKYKKLEENYITDTDILKKEIEKYKRKYKQIKVDHKILSQRYETLSQKYNVKVDQIEKNKEFYIEEIKRLQNDVRNLENEQCLKSNEIIRLCDYYNKIRRDNENRITNLNEKLSIMELSNKKQSDEINSLTDLSTATKVLQEEKKKLSESLKISFIEIQELKDQNLKLQTKINNTQSLLDFAIEDKKNISQSYTEEKIKILQTHAEEKKKFSEIEKKLQNIITNISTEKNSPVKIIRTTLRNTSFNSTLGENIDDTYENMLKNITMLKDEIRVCKEDNEKLNKDLAYAKKNAEDRNVLINLMEKKFSEDVENKVKNCKAEVVKSVYKLMKKYDKKIDGFCFQINCALNGKNIINADGDFSVVRVNGDCLHALQNGHDFLTELIKEFENEFYSDLSN
ncbi:hypothetical protein SteCoe_2764 [Stentor coeruleus]|uniref:Uncharacterized protein n=1 Tax=Stentor coeruleus TaxID=5963 RepID=A0A1R2CYP7_9CILI|nr:hypothetical protein SteCoe_2764 [Stentor coeruleus]